jgi:hypothetical protein
MTSNATDREDDQQKRWNIVVAVFLTVAGFSMTIYSAAIITGLIVQWLSRPY